jgi:exodeoxyribonuclease VII large subunit
LVQPKAFIGKKSSEIHYYKQGLKLNLDSFLRKNNHDLAHYASLIKVMSPENILKKGFAYLQVKGKIVSDVNGLQAHDELTVVTAKHILNTKIESINETNKS